MKALLYIFRPLDAADRWYKAMPYSKKHLLNILLIVVLGFAAYSNTYDVPFQWDEGTFIRDNPIVHDLRYFIEPELAKDYHTYDAFQNRYLGFLTFAINYKIGGLDVFGYHVVNNTLHVFNAILVYLFVFLLFRTPAMFGGRVYEYADAIAIVTATVFVAHPIQTQSVTYIFQRLNLLAAFFTLLSVTGYLWWRLVSRVVKTGWWWYALAIISAVVAMKTKENAFILPLLIALVEGIFFVGPLKKRALFILPFVLCMAIIPLSLVGFGHGLEDFLDEFVKETRNYEEVSRLTYFVTQYRVLVTYLRLMAFPIGQNIDYDYPHYHSFGHVEVIASLMIFLLHIVAVFAFILFKRGPLAMRASYRMAAFGILWFLVALSVESTIIPIPMMINEYRLYLPSVGAFAGVFTLVAFFYQRLDTRRIKGLVMLVIICFPLSFAVATYARNATWQSRVSLWADTVEKSPEKARPHYNYALALHNEGHYEYAYKHYEKASELEPENIRIQINLAIVSYELKQYEHAIEHLDIALAVQPDNGKALFNRALVHLDMGDLLLARRDLEAVPATSAIIKEAVGFIFYIDSLERARSISNSLIEK